MHAAPPLDRWRTEFTPNDEVWDELVASCLAQRDAAEEKRRRQRPGKVAPKEEPKEEPQEEPADETQVPNKIINEYNKAHIDNKQ